MDEDRPLYISTDLFNLKIHCKIQVCIIHLYHFNDYGVRTDDNEIILGIIIALELAKALW